MVPSKIFKRPQVCLLTVLRSRALPSSLIIVANIHVLFNPNRGDQKLVQVLFSLRALSILKKKWEAKGYNVRLLLCGDFNLIPSSAAYKLVT